MSDGIITASNDLSNTVIATGRVVSRKDFPNGRSIITLATKNGRDVFPRFFCETSLIPSLPEHARVRITAHVASTRKKDKATDKWKAAQRFEADTVEPDKTMTEQIFGVSGKFYTSPEINIYIRGNIQDVRDEGEWVRNVLRLPSEDNKHTTVRFSMRKGSKKAYRYPELKVGDEVAAICSVTTPKKEVNGETRFFEDLIVLDLAKI